MPTGGESMIVPIIVGGNEAAIALQTALGDCRLRRARDSAAVGPPGTARLRVTVRYPVADADLAAICIRSRAAHAQRHDGV